MSLPPQISPKQPLFSLRGGHFFPPFTLRAKIWRDLLLTPTPHLWEHEVHRLHGDTTQSRGTVEKCVWRVSKKQEYIKESLIFVNANVFTENNCFSMYSQWDRVDGQGFANDLPRLVYLALRPPVAKEIANFRLQFFQFLKASKIPKYLENYNTDDS